MLKDGLVLIWELDKNLVPTLLFMYIDIGLRARNDQIIKFEKIRIIDN